MVPGIVTDGDGRCIPRDFRNGPRVAGVTLSLRSMKDDLMIQIRWKSQVLYKRLMEICVRIRELAGEESQSLS